MDWIVSGFVSLVTGAINGCILWPQQGASTFYKSTIMSTFFEVFQYIGAILWVVGVIYAISDFATARLEGDEPNIGLTGRNIIYGFIATILIQKGMILAMEAGTYLVEITITLFNGVQTNPSLVGIMSIVSSPILQLILLLTFLILLLITVFQSFRRVMIVIPHIFIGYLYIPGICRGNFDPFAGWFKQSVGISSTQFFQVILCNLAVWLIFSPGDVGDVVGLTAAGLSIGSLMAATAVEKLMQQFAISGGTRQMFASAGRGIREGMQSVSSFKNMMPSTGG